MFMRRACVVSLLLVSCFDGGDATGLPCTANDECGNEICIDGFCGGAPTTSGTTPSTSETESMTSLVTMTDPTTTETEPSTTMTTTTTMSTDTTADTTAEESDSDESSTTSNPVGCEPLPPPPGACVGKDLRIQSPVVSTVEYGGANLGRAMSVIAGDFVGGDDVADLAVVSLDPAQMTIVRNENPEGELDQWDVTATLAGDAFTSLAAYDVVVGDLACDGGTVFAFAGQAGLFGFVGWSPEFTQFNDILTIQGGVIPPNSYSLALADVVDDGDNAPDIVLAGNTHVTLVRNVNGFYDARGVIPLQEATAVFAEPWDVQVVGSGAGTRIFVPQGDETDITAPGNQRVFSLRYDSGDVELDYANPAYIADYEFRNPWALAVGNFLGDATEELAVAERNVDNDTPPGEGTTESGTIRFFSLADPDALTLVETVTVGVGPNSLAAADFDCDGFSDLLVGNGGPYPPGEGGTPEVIFGAEDLSSPTIEPLDVTDISPASRIAIADFDRDGRPEAAIGDYGLPAATNRFVIVDVN